jgi:hypothetical protein
MSQPADSSFTNDEYLYLTFLLNSYNNNIQQIRNLNNETNDLKNRIINLMERNLGINRNNRYSGVMPRRYMNFRSRDRNNYSSNIFNNLNTSNISNISNIFESFFEPVQINPSIVQIENALRVVRYGDIIRPQNQSCPISLETFNDNSQVSMIRHCGHIFNTIEINRWFQSNCRCPVCRYDIRNYRIRDNSSNIIEDISTNVIVNNSNFNLENENNENNDTNHFLTILFQNLLNPTSTNNDNYNTF